MINVLQKRYFILFYDYRTLFDLSFSEVLIRYSKRLVLLILLALLPLEISYFKSLPISFSINYAYVGLMFLFLYLEIRYYKKYRSYRLKKFANEYLNKLGELFYPNRNVGRAQYIKGISISDELSSIYLSEEKYTKFFVCVRYKALLLSYLGRHAESVFLLNDVITKYPYNLSERKSLRAEKARLILTKAAINLETKTSQSQDIENDLFLVLDEFRSQGMVEEEKATVQTLNNLKSIRHG